MDAGSHRILTDDNVGAAITDLVKEARQYVEIASPYVSLWGHAKEAIQSAVRRSVIVTFLVREDWAIEPNSRDTIDWLAEHGVGIAAVHRLHAKIYLNESKVLLSSMNLLKESFTDSREIAILVEDIESGKAVREYLEDLKRGAKRIQLNAPSAEESGGSVPRQVVQQYTGHCIRCGCAVSVDIHKPLKPLCNECYSTWAIYENEEYEENVCFVCGQEAEVSYAHPLCRKCYAKARSS